MLIFSRWTIKKSYYVLRSPVCVFTSPLCVPVIPDALHVPVFGDQAHWSRWSLEEAEAQTSFYM